MSHPPIVDFPKIRSPFKRVVNERDEYIVTPELEEGFEWIFEEGVRAVQEPIDILSKNDKKKSLFLLGLLHSAERGWLESFVDGPVFGELIGPEINTNLHETPHPLFVPFSYLYDKCHWKSWINNKYPKTYDSISGWFQNLTSLFTERMLKKQVLAEGLVLIHPNGRMAKLRRDMFDWYQGPRHKE
jgi:hypothetical protein